MSYAFSSIKFEFLLMKRVCHSLIYAEKTKGYSNILFLGIFKLINLFFLPFFHLASEQNT
jgi:hypothetical protein